MNVNGMKRLLETRASKEVLEEAALFATLEQMWHLGSPSAVLTIGRLNNLFTHKECERFAVWSARQVISLMKEPKSVKAVTTRQAYLDGKCSCEEVDKAISEAEAVTQDCGAPDKAAIWDGFDAAQAAVVAYANGAGANAKDELEQKEKWHAAMCEAQEVQADWLRKNTLPNFILAD